MFCYLNNIKKDRIFFYKKPTDNKSNYFWIVTVQDWYKISPANADCSLGIFNFWNVIDIDFFLVKISKINAAFLIINEESLQKTANFYLQRTLNGS